MALTRPKYSQIYDTDYKQSIRAATTVDVGDLYTGNTQPDTVDGVLLRTSDRILVKDQANTTQNGIYVVRTIGNGINGWWTRSLDADQNDFITSGMTTIITEGNLNVAKTFRLTTPDPIYLGNTALTFTNPFSSVASPGGSPTQVQFNDLGSLSGTAGFTFNKTSNLVTVGGNITAGNILPSANITYSLGSETLQWKDLWVSGNSIYIGGSALTVANGQLSIGGNTVGAADPYGNVNVKAYTETMGLANYSNVNVAAYTQTQSFTNYSNVNVAAYVTTNGLTNYSNVNVAAYTTTQSYTNYSNVNVAAYTQTQSYTNYSNVNLSAYLGGAVTVGGNLTVNGNLFVNGNLTTINANNLVISDSMIYLADDNPTDTLDIGFVSSFTNPGYQHTGFVRDATDGVWKLFANVVAEPTTTIDFTNANYSNILVGNVLARTIIATSFAGNGAALTGLPAGYSNVNASTFFASGTAADYINTSGNISAGNITVGNIITTGSGQFSGPFNENTTVSGVFVGNLNTTPRIGFFNGNTTQNWQIDNSDGSFRWYTPGVVQMSLNSSGTLTVGNILPTANNVSNIGSASSKFRIIHAQATQAQYADLAEIYSSDQQYPSGTVVIFGGEAEVTQSNSPNDPRIAGVVSTEPAYLMNGSATGIPVALQGRVPCRVLGPVSKGDRVVSSHIAGVAQALDPLQYQPGCIIGKALQAVESTDISIIEVVVGRV